MSFIALNLPSTRVPLERTPWPPGAELKSKFGQACLWHDQSRGGRHLDSELLEQYRQVGDERVDRILELMERDGVPLRAGDDLIDLSRECFRRRASLTCPRWRQLSDETRQAMAEFYGYYYRLPAFAKLDDILQGQRVLLTYLPAIGVSLYYRSLVPGFSIPKIAAVLRSTGYLAPPSSRERVLERLLDTGAFLAACSRGSSNSNLSDLLGGGLGWNTALQVRVLHAKVRRSLLHRNSLSRRAWDVDSLGIPLNEEDMAVTLLAFSTNALLGCETILGFPMPQEERLAYMSFWRYVGWLLGVPTMEDTQPERETERPDPLDPCGPGRISSQPNVTEHSYAVFQSIIFHILQPDETSVLIAHHLLRMGSQGSSADKGAPRSTASDNWFYFRALQCRRFIGDPLADALQLPFHPIWWRRALLWVASGVYLVLLRCYTIASLPGSPLRGLIFAYHRRKIWSFLNRWMRGHRSRMKDRLKESIDSGRAGSSGKDTESEPQSVCPFAMVTTVN
jgi:hypothetical protein